MRARGYLCRSGILQPSSPGTKFNTGIALVVQTALERTKSCGDIPLARVELDQCAQPALDLRPTDPPFPTPRLNTGGVGADHQRTCSGGAPRFLRPRSRASSAATAEHVVIAEIGSSWVANEVRTSAAYPPQTTVKAGKS